MNFIFKNTGITVLTGENNTGKSSVTKALFAKYGDRAVYIDNFDSMTLNDALNVETKNDIPVPILKKLNEVCTGNISVGIKTFAVIKRLLENGKIKDGGILIIEEPETHLHPSWQLVLAEIIVLMRKYLNVSILLSTHSPYFLHAIEVYAAYYSIADQCSYYLAVGVDKFENVTDSIDRIYKKFLEPIQKLEDIQAEI